MNKTVSKSVRLTENMAARIDAARGDVSWSRWVERALECELGRDVTVDTATGPRRMSSFAPGEAVPVRSVPPTQHLPTCRCPVCKPPK